MSRAPSQQLLLFPSDRVVRVALPQRCACGALAMAFAERAGRVVAWCNPFWAAGCAPVCEAIDV